MAERSELITSLNVISELLEGAIKCGLQAEVVTWALKFMKENSKLSIEEAMIMGSYEWIK